MKRVLIASLLLVGCDQPRILPHRVIADNCRAYVYDVGSEHAKIDRRAWLVLSCEDGKKWGTFVLDDPKGLRDDTQ